MAVMEKYLCEYHSMEKEYYFSILPTATPDQRNAIFSDFFLQKLSSVFPRSGSREKTTRTATTGTSVSSWINCSSGGIST